jgi:NAD(P)-dependent dehydrogenase (short-subunit alcohol dehydrogenase family)|tara:strand:+ start:363 stop:1100 length:738 start_codon:yes stop_codon:yes gene_type:complete
MRLKNKNIVVTAAAQGIGRATALMFAKEGARVIATDINEKKLSEISKENNEIKTYKLDATNKTEVEKFCSTISDIDVLFHAVGFVHHGTLMDCDDDEFHRSVNVNIYSAYLMSYNLLPKMLKKEKGNIIIVSSGASSIKGAPNRFIYGTTKAALNGFVKAMAVDYVKKGIRCNAILPGTVETPSWQGRVNMADDPIKAREDFIARQAMGRLAQPEEIASLAIYLASDESDFVTGTLNLIDGGWTL